MTPAASSPPVVMLHGFTGTPSSWDGVVSVLPSGAAVRVPALPGHAPGRRFPPGDTFGAVVRRFCGEIEKENRGPVHLVGYSMGGRIALGMLLERPDLFARATLIGVHPGLCTRKERIERRRADAEWIRILREEGIEAFVDLWERQPLFASQDRLDPAVLERQRKIRLAHDPSGLAAALEVLGLAEMPDTRPGLAGIGVPVDLVAGERDRKFRAAAEEMAELLPRGRVRVVPGCGHNVPLEDPDACARLLV